MSQANPSTTTKDEGKAPGVHHKAAAATPAEVDAAFKRLHLIGLPVFAPKTDLDLCSKDVVRMWLEWADWRLLGDISTQTEMDLFYDWLRLFVRLTCTDVIVSNVSSHSDRVVMRVQLRRAERDTGTVTRGKDGPNRW